MNISTALKQLKDKYPWLNVELGTIHELMEETCASAYRIGVEESGEPTTEYTFTAYGEKEDCQ